MKTCKMSPSQLCNILEVDGAVVGFYDLDAAAYFKEHYSQLGYQVEIKPDIGNIKDIEISKSSDFAIRESNGKWILYVDNISIYFNNSAAIDYFNKHYTKLGYSKKS